MISSEQTHHELNKSALRNPRSVKHTMDEEEASRCGYRLLRDVSGRDPPESGPDCLGEPVVVRRAEHSHRTLRTMLAPPVKHGLSQYRI